MKILQELLEAKLPDVELRYEIAEISDITDLSNFDKIAKRNKRLNNLPGPTVMINKCGITSLDGLPLERNWKNITIAGNAKLKNLVGLPKSIERELYLGWNELTDLTGMPEHVGILTMVGEKHLTKFNAFPKTIEKHFYANAMLNLQSLSGIGAIEHVGEYIQIGISSNHLVTDVLGVLKIDGLKRFELNYSTSKINARAKALCEIIKKYLPKGDLFDCQEELIEAGFEKQAQL